MKIWVDDIRTPPDNTWYWCKTSQDAIQELIISKMMSNGKLGGICSMGWITEMSLDHDLGGDDTTRPIVLWCCENDFWPVEVRIHTANPVGRDWLEGMIERYKHEG
jgi:hypothetical protein